jgi:DNA primase
MHFQQVKGQLDIVTVAKQYGIEVNSRGKALCFVHNDTKPSLSFKGQRYKCFACSASGDVIDMVASLTGQSPLEAAKSLDASYGLGVFDRNVDKKELDRLQQEAKARTEEKARLREERENKLTELAIWLREYERENPSFRSNEFVCREHQFLELLSSNA